MRSVFYALAALAVATYPLQGSSGLTPASSPVTSEARLWPASAQVPDGALTTVAIPPANVAVAVETQFSSARGPMLDGPDARLLPSSLLRVSDVHKYVVVVDLPRARLYVLENLKGALRVVRQHYVSMGKNGFGKQVQGDNRTPVGIYTATGFTPSSALPPFYGAGAFPLNYPNNWDFLKKRTGHGIWLHGVPPDTYARAPRSSEGCVTMANADLAALKPYLNFGSTPIVLADGLDWRDAAETQAQAERITAEIENWRARWSAMDTEGYLGFYAADFTANGLDKAGFTEYKRRINAAKKYINVQVRNLDLFAYPGEQDLVLAQFTQDYDSDNYKVSNIKQQYWRRQADGRWQIVLEESR